MHLNFQDMLFAPLKDPPNFENAARPAGPVLRRGLHAAARGRGGSD